MTNKIALLFPGLLLTSFFIANAASASKLAYDPITPCRAVDTRKTDSKDPVKSSERPRIFKAYGGDLSNQGGQTGGCINPREINNRLPVAIAANIVAVGRTATGNGNLVVYPGDAVAPGTSTVNYTVGTNISNSTIISLAKNNANNFNVQSNRGDVHVVIDILGYFYETALSHVITVSPGTDGFGGGDFSDPVAALASVQSPSDTNRYLIKMGPGVYNLDGPLQMKEYVDIQGAGENMTHLMRTQGAGTPDTAASAIIAASHSTLRDLTVATTGDNESYAIGIYNGGNTTMKISHVTVKASGASVENNAVLTVVDAAPVIDNSMLSGVGPNARGLLATEFSSPLVINSMLTSDADDATSLGLLLLSLTTAQIVNSRITGGIGGVIGAGGGECRASYDENLADVTC